MFRFNDRNEKEKLYQKELYKNVQMKEKPKFRQLVSLMFAQYLIILPVAFIGMIIFILIFKLLLSFWGA